MYKDPGSDLDLAAEGAASGHRAGGAWTPPAADRRSATARRRTASSCCSGCTSPNDSRMLVREDRSAWTAPPGRNDDAFAQRLRVERALVDGVVQRDPGVVAADRDRPRRVVAEMALEGVQQRVAPAPVGRDRLGELLHVTVAGQVVRGEQLRQRRRVDIRVDLELHEPVEDGPARRDPADAQPAADRLRERVDVDDVCGRFFAQPLERRALVADRRVDAVVEDEEAARAGELDESLATARREVGASRVRARRLQRDELDLVAARIRSSASMSGPSSSTGSGRTRAPVCRSDASAPANVGDSMTATSPGPRIARATRSRAWRAPDVTRISSALRA